VDWVPFAERTVRHGQVLRAGLSGWFGGADNGNAGVDPGLDAGVALAAVDFEYTIGRFDFRGVGAYTRIRGAGKIGNGTAEAILGWYLEAAAHLFPEVWREGRLRGSDVVVFVRGEVADTQYRMPSGVARDPAGDRQVLTIGLGFYLRPNLVVKADYQITRDASDTDPPDLLNFGLGWSF
jgi:hypothetical protein